MRLIRVTYRATFEQPKEGPLNRLGIRVPGSVDVEVYPAPGGKWWARTPANGSPQKPPWPLVAAPTAEQMCQDVKAQFETQLTPWEMWGNPGPEFGLDRPRLLQPDELVNRIHGELYFKEEKKCSMQGRTTTSGYRTRQS